MTARRPRKPYSPAARTAPSRGRFGASWITWGVLIVVLLAIIAYFLLQPRRPVFDGDLAFGQLVAQTTFGPRSPGSEGHQKTREYLFAQLQSYADDVKEQTFEYRDKQDTSTVYTGVNLVASFNIGPDVRRRMLLSAHWDTRPFADQDADPDRRLDSVPGANDGASGVAVLLEIARILKENPPDIGVDIVFFDLEDMGHNDAEAHPDSLNRFCIGSRTFVEMNPTYRPAFGILLDMIGDRNLRIPVEDYSSVNAPAIVEKVWAAAERAGSDAFVRERGPAVYDDHVPFLEAGIPVIDLIDFDYPYWHTVDDTSDKCSPESLRQVGQTLIEVIYSETGS